MPVQLLGAAAGGQVNSLRTVVRDKLAADFGRGVHSKKDTAVLFRVLASVGYLSHLVQHCRASTTPDATTVFGEAEILRLQEVAADLEKRIGQLLAFCDEARADVIAAAIYGWEAYSQLMEDNIPSGLVTALGAVGRALRAEDASLPKDGSYITVVRELVALANVVEGRISGEHGEVLRPVSTLVSRLSSQNSWFPGACVAEILELWTTALHIGYTGDGNAFTTR